MKQLVLFSCFVFGTAWNGSAQTDSDNLYLKHPLDIGTYDVNIMLNDENDVIHVKETITFMVTDRCDSFFIDLQSVHEGKGMTIQSLSVDYEWGTYTHRDNRIWVQADPGWYGHMKTISIDYSGVPETGLIIGQNKFGDRTFFGDNWPNRAHHWLACVDHPSDKANVNFTIAVPSHYDVIATGVLKNKVEPNNEITRYYFRSDDLLPTKVMVVGVADFETKEFKSDLGFPVTAWAYPQDAEKAFNDMKVALDVTEFYIATVGEYPFEKLANVQSTTQFGGMENAGNIFYDENAVTGEKTMEALIAHEIAHQWFGNSASELDWEHLWLSEGFATYFTDVYWEHTYGTEAMHERLIGERNRVIQFAQSYDHPVIDEHPKSLMHLLNPNSYQKGAWVLHMLRNKLGDDVFFEGIRKYYERYKYSNAETDDLMEIMQSVADVDLSDFFEQWLRTSGHPILKIESSQSDHGVVLTIEQMQDAPFVFDLEVEVLYADGPSELIVIPVTDRDTSFDVETSREIVGFRYDPNVKLLFEQVEH